MSMHDVRSICQRGGCCCCCCCCRALTYCGYEGGVKGVLAESEQQTCLPDSAVSDQKQLEQIIVRFRHFLNKLESATFRQCVRPGSPAWKSSAVCGKDGSRPVPRGVTPRFALHYGPCSLKRVERVLFFFFF